MALRLHTHGVDVMYSTIALICETLFYGIYAALIPFSTFVLLKRGLKTRADALMCGLNIFMFTLATAYWGASVATLFTKIHTFFIAPTSNGFPSQRTYGELFNALVLINFTLADGVVVWRAWVLCKDGKTSKKLMFLLILFSLTALSVATTVGIRVAITAHGGDGHHSARDSSLNRGINVSQVTSSILSLLTNLVATSIISIKAWKYRQLIKTGLKQRHDNTTLVGRVFDLLVESGTLYCLSSLMVVVSTAIHLPHGTLGDIYTRVNVQIAGIYPTIVLILVSMQRTMNDTTFCYVSDNTPPEFRNRDAGVGPGHDLRSQISTMRFANQGIDNDKDLDETTTDDGGFQESQVKKAAWNRL